MDFPRCTPKKEDVMSQKEADEKTSSPPKISDKELENRCFRTAILEGLFAPALDIAGRAISAMVEVDTRAI